MSSEIGVAKDNQSKFELNPPALFRYLEKKNSEFVGTVKMIASRAEQHLSMIPNIFPGYTLHDINHSIRIIDYMYKLIDDVEKLTDLEITVLICSALLHDTGMYCSTDEIQEIKKNNYSYSEINFEALLQRHQGDEDAALQHFIRENHARRSAVLVKSLFNDQLFIPSQSTTNFVESVALICESHNESVEWVTRNLPKYEEKGRYSFNPQYCALLLRLGDILDFDSQRTPAELYRIISPKGFSKEEWEKHFIIDNRDKIKFNDERTQKKIYLMGSCADVGIHRKVLDYIHWINKEINSANIITDTFDNKYRLNLKYPVENNIRSNGFSFSDLQLNIEYSAVSKLLIGENLYNNKKHGLRELIQNSIDACNMRKSLDDTTRKFGEDEYKPVIKIIMDEDENMVTVEDNGVGMSIDTIRNYFLRIGKSYYSSDDYLLKGLNYTPIGNFGIGFLACFMLSDNVEVETRYFKNKEKYKILLTKDSEFVCLDENENVSFNGTKISLDYKSFMEIFNNSFSELCNFIKEYFVTNNTRLEIIDRKREQRETIENVFLKSSENNHLNISDYLQHTEGFIEVENNSLVIQDDMNSLFGDKCMYFDGENIYQINTAEIDMDKIYNPVLNKISYLEVSLLTDEYLEQIAKENRLKLLKPFDDSTKKIIILLGIDVSKELKMTSYFTDGHKILSLAEEVLDRNLSDAGLIFNDIPPLLKKQILELDIEEIYKKIVVRKGEIRLHADCKARKLLLIDEFSSRNHLFHEVPEIEDRAETLYLRNVLVDNWALETHKKSSNIHIGEIKVNVINKIIEPTLTRSDLRKESKKILSDALAMLPLINFMQNNDLSKVEENLIKSFIQSEYPNGQFLLLESIKEKYL
ncbi:HD domain-containing protein [Domibacillus iocasae]|uniref:HD-CE domain-containing protein n=1 Tax=Domibacillus iocasae TaxID=1714016 RepID=A0A1E7DS59_9BACI|nr:ATP-binding protein [Domibacillus iocasae]OES45845.1 hypothetical protein BA724_03315 [Domibacillus iocasae]